MTKQFRVWQWLLDNGPANTDEIMCALDFSKEGAKRQLQTLRTKGHVTAGKRPKYNVQVKYTAVASKPPAEDGLYAAAQAKRRKQVGDTVPLAWEGFTRRELNPLITMPLVRFQESQPCA